MTETTAKLRTYPAGSVEAFLLASPEHVCKYDFQYTSVGAEHQQLFTAVREGSSCLVQFGRHRDLPPEYYNIKNNATVSKSETLHPDVKIICSDDGRFQTGQTLIPTTHYTRGAVYANEGCGNTIDMSNQEQMYRLGNFLTTASDSETPPAGGFSLFVSPIRSMTEEPICDFYNSNFMKFQLPNRTSLAFGNFECSAKMPDDIAKSLKQG